MTAWSMLWDLLSGARYSVAAAFFAEHPPDLQVRDGAFDGRPHLAEGGIEPDIAGVQILAGQAFDGYLPRGHRRGLRVGDDYPDRRRPTTRSRRAAADRQGCGLRPRAGRRPRRPRGGGAALRRATGRACRSDFHSIGRLSRTESYENVSAPTKKSVSRGASHRSYVQSAWRREDE